MTTKHRYILGCLLGAAALHGCKKAPEETNYLSPQAAFEAVDYYEPVLGRTFLRLTNFQANESSYPLEFILLNPRDADGKPAPELLAPVSVKEWVRDYNGLEASVAEIEAKRRTVQKPFFEVRRGSGDFIFWKTDSNRIRTYPDPGYLFDIRVQNAGNARIFENMKLRPLKEMPYEPYEYDARTRLRKTETRISATGVNYTAPYSIHPELENVLVARDTTMNDSLTAVRFRRTGDGNSLTFIFLDQDSLLINPAKFNITRWDELVHGFNKVATKDSVRYEVAYPIPLTSFDTKYAKSGRANLVFGYSRMAAGNRKVDARFRLSFSIYEPGDWQIIFRFYRNPLMNDE